MRGQEQWLQAARRGWMAEAGRIKTPLRGGGCLPAAQEPVGLYPALACSPDKTRSLGQACTVSLLFMLFHLWIHCVIKLLSFFLV